MAWYDPLTAHLLDFLCELEKNGLKNPLIIAGGFGLFLKRRYLAERKVRTLFDDIGDARSTQDIDIFVRTDVLCDRQQSQSIVDVLYFLNYEVMDNFKYLQWKKTITTGDIKIDFLVGNIDDHRQYLHIKKPRARNRQVEGFHAHITPEALFINEKALNIPLAGKRSNGEEYKTSVCIPHPFTYLIMKLFAFRDRLDDPIKRKASHHAFDIFSIIGALTEQEFNEAIEFGNNHVRESPLQEAIQIVEDSFSKTSSTGVIAIKNHQLFKKYCEAEQLDDFLQTLMEVFGAAH